MSLLFDAVLFGAAIAVGIAFYKHHTLSAVVTSAQKELVILEGIGAKVSTDVQAAFTASIARLKAIFPKL